MKKYNFILVGLVLLIMTSCGGESTTKESTDSSETQVLDSTNVSTDSVETEITEDVELVVE